MQPHRIAQLILIFLLLQQLNAQRITYKASVRGHREPRNLFLQINEGTSNHCRLDAGYSTRDIDFTGSCSIPYSDSGQLSVELRHDRSGGKDDHLGWAYVHLKNMRTEGTLEAPFWVSDGDFLAGTLRIIVTSVS